MTSTLDCLGLGVPDDASLRDLVLRAFAAAAPVGPTPSGGFLLRWQDPSGARMVLECGDNAVVVGMVPSYDGEPGALLTDVVMASAETAVADVIDDQGDLATRMGFDLEQRSVLRDAGRPAEGRASVVGLGVDVRAFEGPDAFAHSDASLLAHPTGGSLDWIDPDPARTEPLRVSAESFIPSGLFGDGEPQPYARLSGTVLAVRRKQVALTGGRFTVARVRTHGMTMDLCLPGDQPDVAVGGVLSGTAYLVADLPGLDPSAP